MDMTIQAIPIEQPGPGEASLHRVDVLKNQLRENDVVEFRFRAVRYTGRVVNLGPKYLQIDFQLSGEKTVRRVPYGSVIRVVN
jgi:hypothetical protein